MDSTGQSAIGEPRGAQIECRRQPGLVVHGVGDISTPLREEQARQLIAQSRQAPFGRGSETVVDTSVGNTWQLDASQFEFRNGAWAQFLDSCIQYTATYLGVTSPIQAELYKMLIHETGAMFKAHTDTEKIPGMFGTPVICLPSPHQGGDVVVKHQGQTKTFTTSQVQPSMLCWYSDVHHEVLPVTSGYRWVLIYNLAIPPDLERPSAALLQFETQELHHLRRCHIFYLLEHEYTEHSIAPRALKTTDLARVQCLKNLSDELEFDVFLAVLERMVMGSVEMDYDRYDGYRKRKSHDAGDPADWHDLEEVFKNETHTKKLVDLDGRLVRSENLIPECDPFEDSEDRNENYQGYMGNSGPTATQWYRATIAAQSPSIPALEFNLLWLPFLRDLVGVLTWTSTPLATPRYQQLVIALVETYVDRHVGPEPAAAVDWMLNPVRCYKMCSDCVQLNAFLASPTRTTARFSAGQKRRTHLRRMIECLGQQARDTWAARRRRVAEELLAFEPSALRALLGEEEHAKIMARLVPMGPVADGGLRTVSNGSVTGMKRKAEDEGRY
ncbi:hypothetical protein MFIFM68171_11184 [Madurella fahalii]|uniref:Prolyl 4-hydroxylase alpha subunit Fe(2+) 2OG dioxygenase domain-containing protein n=1 Tax=Madurella fahalii TaxID=1157608 RepID=A0ABQ0GTB4_9PEZI